MQLSTPFILHYFRTWYANTEILYTYADNVNEYRNSAVPYKIYFTFIKPNQQSDRMVLELDKEKTVAAYKKLGGAEQSNPLELYFEMPEDMSSATVYLKNSEEKIELEIKKVYLAK